MKTRPSDSMTDEEIRAKALTHCFDLIDSLIYGGGELEGRGLGLSTDTAMSMTDASECHWGSSGRGNSRVKAGIRAVAGLGYLKVQKIGRTERVSLTQKGLDLYNRPEFNERRASQDAQRARFASYDFFQTKG